MDDHDIDFQTEYDRARAAHEALVTEIEGLGPGPLARALCEEMTASRRRLNEMLRERWAVS